MKRRFQPILLITAGLLIGLFVTIKVAPRLSHLDRKEIASLPGAFEYSEGTSRVPELFDEAKAFLENGKVARAETVYRKIITLEPNNALVLQLQIGYRM